MSNEVVVVAEIEIVRCSYIYAERNETEGEENVTRERKY